MPGSLPASIARFEVVRRLGEGGMGAVFLARDPAIDRLVAIKLMRAGLEGTNLRERFAREARSIGRLHHPNIVTIFEFGEHHGEPFIAMEYVEGQTLGLLIEQSALTIPEKLGLMDGLCAGLDFAHRAGIIHRDIKPANIMVDVHGNAKILDFGIARGPIGTTQAGVIIGTLNYMSPEQLSGKLVDQRTDIFSLGAVFYELLSGRSAFPGDIASGVLNLILVEGPAPLARVSPTLDSELVVLVDKCLERNPNDRISELTAIRRDIRRLQRKFEESGSEPEIVSNPARTPSGEPLTPARTPGVDTRQELTRLRQERIDQQMTEARRAAERGDYALAIEACRQVLIIEHEHAEALDLRKEAEAHIQARVWFHEAEVEFQRGAITAAGMLIDRVLAVDPTMVEAVRLRGAIADDRRKLDEAARQARLVELEAAERAAAALANSRSDKTLLVEVRAETATDAAPQGQQPATNVLPSTTEDPPRTRVTTPERREPRRVPTGLLIGAGAIVVVLLAIVGRQWLPGAPEPAAKPPQSTADGASARAAQPSTPETAVQPPSQQPLVSPPNTAGVSRPPLDPPGRAASAGGSTGTPRPAAGVVSGAKTGAPPARASSSSVVVPPPSPAAEAAAHVRLGDQHQQNDRYVEARAEFRLAVDRDPTNQDAQAKLSKLEGVISQDIRRYLQQADRVVANDDSYCGIEQALGILRRVLALDAENSAAKRSVAALQAVQIKNVDRFRAAGQAIPRCSGGGS